MQRRNLFLLVSFISSIVGIALIYYAAINVQSSDVGIGDITNEMIGRSVTTSGYISYKTVHPDGHIFLTLADENDAQSKISVPLFAGFVNELRKNRFNTNRFQRGAFVEVSGLVDEYRGQLQIIPRKVSDIKILAANGD